MGREGSYSDIIIHNSKIKRKLYCKALVFVKWSVPKHSVPCKNTPKESHGGPDVIYKSAYTSFFTMHKRLSIWYTNSFLTTNSSHDACCSTYVQHHHLPKLIETLLHQAYLHAKSSKATAIDEKTTQYTEWVELLNYSDRSVHLLCCAPHEISTVITYTNSAKHYTVYNYVHPSCITSLH